MKVLPPLLCLLLVACGEERSVKASHRAVAGFSMGAMGATFLGLRHPDRFDAVGALGGPMDAAWMLAYLQRAQLGGFCTLDELEALAAEDPAALDDPSRLGCMEAAKARAEAVLPEHEQAWNSWVYSESGGSFDRERYLDLFTDLSLAFGNPLYFNPDDPALPPRLTREDLLRGEALCDDPVVLEGFYNAEYNPDGRHAVISFCDGEEPALVCRETGRPVDFCGGDPEAFCAEEGGAVRASGETLRSMLGAHAACFEHRRPVSFALAVDLNGNGRRDYGEPVVVNAHERFEDVGVDGCGNDREDGEGGCLPASRQGGPADPNGDDFHWLHNPTGTEGDFRWQQGEPFEDHGLDGVPSTFDHGEGDGRFTESPTRAKWWAHDARTIASSWKRAPFAFYADGGIRDLFNFHVSAAHVWSAFALHDDKAIHYEGTAAFPGAPAEERDFDPLGLSAAELPSTMLWLYGDPQASEELALAGDGDHVGTSRQLLNRLYLFLRWLSVRWAELPDPPADRSPIGERLVSATHVSEALGGVERDYGVYLPPGYSDPRNADERYPVLYLLHGYGMRPTGEGGFLETAMLFDGAMASGRLKKMIVVFPNGRCCHVHEGRRICTESGVPAGAVRSCRSGSFFVDRGGEDDYQRALWELVEEVDRKFRTLR